MGPWRTKILYARKDSTQAFCAQHCSSVALKCVVGQVARSDNGGYIRAVVFCWLLASNLNYHKCHTLCHFYDRLKTLSLPQVAYHSVSCESALNIVVTITIPGFFWGKGDNLQVESDVRAKNSNGWGNIAACMAELPMHKSAAQRRDSNPAQPGSFFYNSVLSWKVPAHSWLPSFVLVRNIPQLAERKCATKGVFCERLAPRVCIFKGGRIILETFPILWDTSLMAKLFQLASVLFVPPWHYLQRNNCGNKHSTLCNATWETLARLPKRSFSP